MAGEPEQTGRRDQRIAGRRAAVGIHRGQRPKRIVLEQEIRISEVVAQLETKTVERAREVRQAAGCRYLMPKIVDVLSLVFRAVTRVPSSCPSTVKVSDRPIVSKPPLKLL